MQECNYYQGIVKFQSVWNLKFCANIVFLWKMCANWIHKQPSWFPVQRMGPCIKHAIDLSRNLDPTPYMSSHVKINMDGRIGCLDPTILKSRTYFLHSPKNLSIWQSQTHETDLFAWKTWILLEFRYFYVISVALSKQEINFKGIFVE